MPASRHAPRGARPHRAPLQGRTPPRPPDVAEPGTLWWDDQTVQVCWLGPLEVRDHRGEETHVVAIPGQRLRLLLGRLAMRPGAWVSADALIETVWGDDPPSDPTNS